MKKILFIAIILIISLPRIISAQDYSAEKVELPGSGLRNLYRIDEGVYRSEQPSEKGFAALEEFGIAEVLNLRARYNDVLEAKRTGLILHHLKSKAKNIDEEQIIETLNIIKNREGPILIHCWQGSDRTGAVVAMYRIIFQDVPKEEAIREMKTGGFGFHSVMFGNIPKMTRKADINHIRSAIRIHD